VAVSPIGGIPGLPGVNPATAARSITAPAGATSGPSSFAQLVGSLVQDSNAQHAQSDHSVQQLMAGETDNLHDVVLDAAKADLSFRLLVEIRNKLLDAYQEIMRMQV